MTYYENDPRCPKCEKGRLFADYDQEWYCFSCGFRVHPPMPTVTVDRDLMTPDFWNNQWTKKKRSKWA